MTARLLEGRVAVVAGVGPGLGRHLALALADHGARLVLAARSQEALEALADELRARGAEAIAVPTDLVDGAACDRLAAAALASFGGIDAVVHNAFTRPSLGPVVDRSPEEWHRSFDVNVVSVATLARSTAEALANSGRGAFVAVSSISARSPHPGSAIYATTKGAVLTLVRALAQELGPAGTTVNALVPGYIEGPGLEVFFEQRGVAAGTTGAGARAAAEAEACLGRFARPAEVAGAAVLLLSDLARAVTGQALDVNAGQSFGP